eukprot:jgi/Chlat1/1250/Chrsp115S01661
MAAVTAMKVVAVAAVQTGSTASSSLRGVPLVAKPKQAAGVLRSKASRSTGVKAEAASETGLTGVVFQPFAEVQAELAAVSQAERKAGASLARQRFNERAEAGINEQINVEYNVSYVYHALYAYFDRDTVALPGLAKYFKANSEEEREHAESFIDYQNMRGGRVKLQSIMLPEMEFDHPEKGDALYAMELTLSLEKLVNEKLLNLHKVAEEVDDPQLQDFIEGKYLAEQVETIKKVSDYVAQLQRVGKGHGVWHWDQRFLEGEI